MEIKKLDEEKCKNLRDLFIEWHERQEEDAEVLCREVNNLYEREQSCPSNRRLNKLLRSSGVPSCFSRFMGDVPEIKMWESVLKNAFNMDGGKKKFEIRQGGYKYIFLFKEANDSEKKETSNYPNFEIELRNGNVNPWIYNWPDRRYRSGISRKLPEVFEKYSGISVLEEQDGFLNYAGYMNVNKRGGESRADERAILNYAKYYKNYILKEIELLGENQKQIKIFVCGGKYYFDNLIRNLGLISDDSKKTNAKYCFINITHPSAPISYKELVEEMKAEKPFNAKLKKGKPVYVSEFKYD